MIVITGGAGFIGSAMLWELNKHGTTDIIVVDDLGSTATGKWKNLSGLSFTDFIHKNEFISWLADNRLPEISTVIHMGAISATTETDASLLMANNYNYSKELAMLCASRKIRFIYASSAATYGDGRRGYNDEEENLKRLRPLNMYGYSKQLFDLWALKTGILKQAVGLKFFNVFGPNEYHKTDMCSVVFKAFQQIKETGTVQLFESHRDDYPHGEQMRDFIYVKDCTALISWLIENQTIHGVFNVGTGQARSFNDLVKATFSALGLESKIQYTPMPETLRDKYQYFTQAEISKLRSYGYTQPLTSLEEGVKDYVNNYLDSDSPYFDNQNP
ncbi:MULTISPECIES: ADP-glyceromanno-heptose 6-epimerase [Prosthecochloris]|uniref:ADP-L-glycero-D-manno-heptose-6-epimerase n=1 Tax=Prosthecochloris marina TaxID=2017681 RepID=A0A317TBV0_9CHLB|nr:MULTISPECIES: ADP-glyceromanno-heptose 6-epimerase [Prosthecochloris]PWW83371.1 ADP-glyceromanno-heptose 6-epimerase [Prosthecochloris marina]UZJ36576.1 ADP-glyceromanno-heptose 6-epimerase [Prosthecochloris sp. SCSIO W1103]